VTDNFANLPDIPSSLLAPDQDARRRELLEAALGYARAGFGVIPVRWIGPEGHCTCQNGAECPSPGKHPVHERWPDVATSDLTEVSSWWREPPDGIATEWWPMANVGLVTGRRWGYFVLDVDEYAGGAQTLGAYLRRNGDMPLTRVHATARGGTHYFWRHPGFDVRNSAKTVLGRGLDIRGENGFVVAPPSVSSHGLYELNPAHAIDPAPAPEWLLDLLRSHDKDQTGSSIAGNMPTTATGAARRYAEAALAAESQRMREAAEGERNDTLNQCAFSLGTLGGAQLIDEDQAWAALYEAALAAGLGEGEIRKTFMSGWRNGLKNPRQVQWNVMNGDWPARPRTEFGLADRMVDHWGDQLRWNTERKTWMIYKGGVWSTGATESGEWFAQEMIRRLPDTEARSYDEDADHSPDGTELPSPQASFLEWVGKQQTRKAVSSAARLATGIPLMRIDEASFDQAPLTLCVKNGVVDLETGDLTPHAPDHRMTLQCSASYRQEGAPLWEDFLRRVQPDPQMRAYLQRVMGYCGTALTTEQVFFLWHGQGANGKSVAQNVLAHVLGTYAQTMPVSTLMASTVEDRIPNDVARIKGRRFLVASETKQGKALDEQRLKQMTGGDTIAARYMRAEWFEFRPVGKIQLTTNHLPRMSDDAATWRRIHLIGWPVIIPEAERDGFLQQRLIDQESAGILWWIVQGALAWREEGLNPPSAVHAAKEEYQAEEDEVAQFIMDCLDVVEPKTGVMGRDSSSIWNSYDNWRTREGHSRLAQRTLTARLRKHGYEHVRSNGWTGFPGLQTKHLGAAGP
jgi:putative DNA primase/helicase